MQLDMVDLYVYVLKSKWSLERETIIYENMLWIYMRPKLNSFYRYRITIKGNLCKSL